MDLNHLHLHVRDVERARQFYETWFGFRERVRHGKILFLRNGDGFDLALAPESEPSPFPEWYHFGFRLPTPDDVRAVYKRMSTDGVTLRAQLTEEPDFVTFRCMDPDGYGIEVYWE
ncbi:MAG: VOC family protein [Planctomycetes bacterium]|nr:VOC family protein [Planctomycetota bacterium]